jgi:hypothetical protein
VSAKREDAGSLLRCRANGSRNRDHEVCSGAKRCILYLLLSKAYELTDESFVIGGWVAMGRPLETLLFDWWPIGAHFGASL